MTFSNDQTGVVPGFLQREADTNGALLPGCFQPSVPGTIWENARDQPATLQGAALMRDSCRVYGERVRRMPTSAGEERGIYPRGLEITLGLLLQKSSELMAGNILQPLP